MGVDKKERKNEYFARLIKLTQEYPKILLCEADNIGSNHMQSIRKALNGKGVLLMGKNTMIRKALRGNLSKNPDIEVLFPYIKGNVGMIFTKEPLSVIKKIIDDNKKQAPARAGAISPVEVIVPAGNTGMEPTQTSFLQALNIPSKISRGQVEIVNDVVLLKEGQKVGPSEAALLAKLNINPFQYGLIVKTIYDDGEVYDAAVLNITDDMVVNKFRAGVNRIASLSLGLGYATAASVPHTFVNAFKNLLSVSIATEYTFKQSEKIKEILANPEAFAAAAAASAPAAAKGGGKKEEKKEKEPEPAAEEEDEDMGFGLFD